MIRIKSHDSFLYREVWEILEWKGDRIFRTKRIGKFVHVNDEKRLDKTKYTTSPISTFLTRNEEIELELIKEIG